MFKLLFNKLNKYKLNFYIKLNFVFDIYFFINLFFFFALMPYVSPIPLGSDVQIITGLIGYIIISVLFLKDKFLVNPREFLIFLLGFLFIVYINPNENTYQFRKAIGPLYAFGVYFVAKKYRDYISLRVIDLVITIYFIGALVQYFSPSLFNLTFEFFIRESKYSIGTARGVTSLAPEPSFLAIVFIYILLIQDWVYVRFNLSKDKLYYCRMFVSIFMILFSKSGAGYILLFLFFAANSISYIKKYWFLMLIILGALISFLSNIKNVSGNKGLSDLVGVLKSTSPKDLLRVSSLSNRVNPVIVGVVGAIEKPFGRGSGSFTTQAKKVYLKNGIDELYPIYMRDRLFYEISSDSVSTFGKYIFEYGIFFLIYIFLVLIGLNLKDSGPFVVFLLLSGLLFSLPIVYPPLWLIFGFYDKKINIK
jgi:hypothetical protein